MALSDQPSASQPSTPQPIPARRPRTARRIIWGVLLVLLLLIGFFALRVAVPGWQGYQAARTLMATLGGEPGPDDAAVIQQSLETMDGSLAGVESALRPLFPLLRGLRRLPRFGPTLAVTPELLAVGREFSALAVEAGPALAPAMVSADTLERAAALAGSLAAEPERLERMAARAESAAELVRDLPAEGLHPALAVRLELGGPILEQLPNLLRALPGIPTLLGMEKQHRIVLLVQNNHELRPTGGFITAVGRVALDKGQISFLDFDDSYVVYKPTSQYPPAPQPMQEYMQIPYLTFRDSNWSPDLPTSGEIARVLFVGDMGWEYDDLITIDLNAVEAIIGALGPLKLEGIDEPVTGSNIMAIMKELWARPADSEASVESEDLSEWWRNRKDFIPKLAQAALQKILSGQAEPLRLGAALVSTLEQRDIQAVLSEPTLAALFAVQGWDGSLLPNPDGDYLAPVDMNMGYNKADAVIQRSLAYTLTWPALPNEGALAQVTLVYTHPLTVTDELCTPTARYGGSYDELTQRCYFAYTRLYVPAGSTLLDITGVDEGTITSQRGEKGTQLFAGYFSLKPGEHREVIFTYQLPATIVAEGYSLHIQRQSGTAPLPVRLHLGDEGVVETTIVNGRWQGP